MILISTSRRLMLLIVALLLTSTTVSQQHASRKAPGWARAYRRPSLHPRVDETASFAAIPSGASVSPAILTTATPRIPINGSSSQQSTQNNPGLSPAGLVRPPINPTEYKTMPDGEVASWLVCRARNMCCFNVSYWKNATSEVRRNTLSLHTSDAACDKKMASFEATDCGFWSKVSPKWTMLRIGHLTGPQDHLLLDGWMDLCTLTDGHVAKLDLYHQHAKAHFDEKYLQDRCSQMCGPAWKPDQMLPAPTSGESVWTNLRGSLDMGDYETC